MVNTVFRCASGVVGHAIWCFNATELARTERTTLVGESGRISYSCFSLDEPILLEQQSGVEEIPVEPPEHVQQPMIQVVVDTLRGLGEAPSTSATALRTSRAMDRILGRLDR